MVGTDLQGAVHALYVDLTDGNLRHAFREGGIWKRELAFTRPGTTTPKWVAFRGLADGSLEAVVDTAGYLSWPTAPALAVRSPQGVWSSAPLATPAGLTNTGTLYEADGTLVLSGVERIGGTSSSSRCEVVIQRRTSTGWSRSAVFAFTSSEGYCVGTSSGLVNALFPFLDGTGHAAMALLGTGTRDHWSVALQNPQGAWEVAVTPVLYNGIGRITGSLASGQVHVDAQGTVHLFGRTGTGSQDFGHVYGGGLFWTTERVTNLDPSISAPPQAMSVNAQGQLSFFLPIHRTTTRDPVTPENHWGFQLYRCHRTGTGTFVTDPALAFELPEDAVTSIEGFDSQGLPLLTSGRQRSARGKGLDLTDFQGSAGRTVALDWKDYVSTRFDLEVDALGSPHVSTDVGESYYGLGRYVVRKLTANGWSESASPLLPAALGNGNELVGKLRIGSDGLRRVLLAGALGNTTADRGLILATERSDGSWSRELVDTTVTGTASTELELTLDRTDAPHVLITRIDQRFSSYTAEVRHLSRSGTTWSSEVIATNFASDGSPRAQLLFDGSDVPTAVFRREDDLAFARFQSGAWQIASMAGVQFRAVRNGQGQICVAHNVPANSTLALDCFTGTRFATTVLAGGRTSLFLEGAATDGPGNVQVLARDGQVAATASDALLMHPGTATADERLAWRMPTQSGYRMPVEMDVAPDGTPWFAWYDDTLKGIRIAHRAP